MLIFHHHHFQLSSLCNWPSSGVCRVYNIPSLGVKDTSSVLWSSANFCSISQNMHYKAPVDAQHWKTNKVVWTWKADWPPWRTSTYERPFTQEGNYLVFNCYHIATDHPHAVKTLVVSLFVQITKFKSYLSSYHPMQKASNWKSGLDIERWLTPWRTSTHERPFTQEGNYLVSLCFIYVIWGLISCLLLCFFILLCFICMVFGILSSSLHNIFILLCFIHMVLDI